ncbi:hypothetical protein BH09BAC6_BH09BAC6_03140 [soil metagenome]|jgi:hypothetical protein
MKSYAGAYRSLLIQAMCGFMISISKAKANAKSFPTFADFRTSADFPTPTQPFIITMTLLPVVLVNL